MRNSIDDKIKLTKSCSRYVNNVVLSEDGLLAIFLSKNVYIYYPTYGEGYFYLVKSVDFEWNLSDIIIENRIRENYESDNRKRSIKEVLKNDNISYESNSIIRSCTWTLSGLFNSSLSLLAILTCNGCCIFINPNVDADDNKSYKTFDVNIQCHNVSIVFDLTKRFNSHFNKNKVDKELVDDKITSIRFFPFFEKESSSQNNKSLLTAIGSNGKLSIWNITKNDDFPSLICDIVTSYEFSSIEHDDHITNLLIIEKRRIPNSYASILCGTSKGSLFMLNLLSDNHRYRLELLWKYETHSSIYDMSIGNDDEIFIAGDAGNVIVTDMMNNFTAIINDLHTNVISGIKVLGSYDKNMNSQRKLPTSLITSSFDGVIKSWNYSNTSKYIHNIISPSSSSSSSINGNIIEKEMQYSVNNAVQGISCDPWGLIFAYSEIEPAINTSSRKITISKQNMGGTAISMMTNQHFASDWCIDQNEWIKLFHIMLSNTNASRLSLLSISIALSNNLQIYYHAPDEKSIKVIKEELIDELSSSDSDESNDNNDTADADETKVDRMKIIVETVLTNKLGKLRFIVSIIIQAIIKIGKDYKLNDNHINTQNMSDEDILWAELLSLPSKASHDIVLKKALLWKTLNHIVQVGEKLHGFRDIKSLSCAKQLRLNILIQNATMNIDRINDTIKNLSGNLSENEKKSLSLHCELLKYHRKDYSCESLEIFLGDFNFNDTCYICSKTISFNVHNPFHTLCESCGIVHDRCCKTMIIASIDEDIRKCPLCRCVMIQSNILYAPFKWLSDYNNSLCPFCVVPMLST